MINNMGNQLIANIFKALGNPTRLHIIQILKEKPLCVCRIIEELGTEQSNTSQHLSVLKSEGIIDSRKEGSSVIYSIKYPKIYGMIETAENILLSQIEETKSSLVKK